MVPLPGSRIEPGPIKAKPKEAKYEDHEEDDEVQADSQSALNTEPRR